MPEINVEQLRIVAIENCPQLLLFTGRNLPRRVLKLLEPEPAQEMSWRFADNLDAAKMGIAPPPHVFARPRSDEISPVP